GDIYSLPDQLAVLADLKASGGNFGEADRLYEEATDVIEAMLVNAASPGLKSSLVGAMGQIFLQHFTLLIQELEDPDRAFELLERARGRTAVDLLALRPEEFAESDFLSSGVQREISELQVRLLRAESPAERNQLLDQLFEVEQYLAPLFAVEFRSRGSAPRKVVGRDSLQDVLGQDELILEYVLDDPVSFCLAISGDQLWVVSLPARAQIEDSVDRYLAEIRSRRSGFEEARKLYSMLVEPIPEYDAKFRLIVVPDGKLHLLPFESLVRPDNEFLVRTQIITYAPSATMLHLLRSAPRRVAPSLPLLAVGNVPYGEPLRVMAMGSSNSRGSQERGGVRGVYDLDGANFTPLPWTAEEVRSVAEVAGPKSVVLTGENASGCLSHRWKTSL
ncbi:MAG: CHAT domain-containing protein, partial [Acidobacteriota bacterium]